MSEWISVSDRLPEEGVDVLGLNTFNGMDRAFCVVVYYEDGGDQWFWFQNERQGYGQWGKQAFSHWMPLPSPPQPDKEQK